MATILQLKYYNLETGQEIPMSQGEEEKESQVVERSLEVKECQEVEKEKLKVK